MLKLVSGDHTKKECNCGEANEGPAPWIAGGGKVSAWNEGYLKVKVRKEFTITEKALTRAFSWSKAPTSASTYIYDTIHAPTKLTNYTLYNILSIAPTVHYCTHDVLMTTKATFKFLVALDWAVTGSAGWCVRSRFAWSAHEHGAMYADARLKLGICLLWVECGLWVANGSSSFCNSACTF